MKLSIVNVRIWASRVSPRRDRSARHVGHDNRSERTCSNAQMACREELAGNGSCLWPETSNRKPCSCTSSGHQSSRRPHAFRPNISTICSCVSWRSQAPAVNVNVFWKSALMHSHVFGSVGAFTHHTNFQPGAKNMAIVASQSCVQCLESLQGPR